MKNNRILLTNDDGIHSPGLSAALNALCQIADLKVVAPLQQQTAMGRAQFGDPDAILLPEKLPDGGKDLSSYACDASPAATVGHAMNVMKTYSPALLVSGINYGENLGTNITSSGTIGAALEAASRGIPSIAISLETTVDSHYHYSDQNWKPAIHFLRQFAEIVLEKGLPEDVHILKIDVPAGATTNTPWRLTKLSPHTYYESWIENPSLSSRLSDAIVKKRFCAGDSFDTDVYTINIDRVVSVTPLTLDFTSRAEFSFIHSWLTKNVA